MSKGRKNNVSKGERIMCQRGEENNVSKGEKE